MAGRDELFKGSLEKALRDAAKIGQVPTPQVMRPVTTRQTMVNLIAAIECVIIKDDLDKCSGYMLKFSDEAEGVIYVYQFDQTLMDVLNQWVNSVPKVGEEIPHGEAE